MVAIDMSAAKAPPRKSQARQKASAATPVTPNESLAVQRRYSGLCEIAQAGQGLCLLTGQFADAAAIGKHHEPPAREIAKLADRYEIVGKTVDLIIQVGPFTALVAACMPLALQLMANHRIVDASKLAGQGIVPPEVLEAQMTAEVMRMQAEAMREQQEAIAAAQEETRRYEQFMAKQQEMAMAGNGSKVDNASLSE
jgi:hypothetical protein